MSSLSKKKPPSNIEVNDSIAELDSTIDSYIEKSPITNKFREENPNLHPVTDDSEGSSHSTLPADLPIFESTPEKPPRPVLQSQKGTEARPSLPPKSGSIRENIRRLARRKSEGSNDSHSFTIKSMNRLSLNSLSRQQLFESHSNDYNSSPRSDYSRSSTSSITSDDGIETKQDTPFWKYHILKFGKDLYLTTNPGLKHIYCRNGPGFYVEVVFPNNFKHHSSREGFRLIFKDLSIKNAGANPEIMVITKDPLSEGGKYNILLPRTSYLDDGAHIELQHPEEDHSTLFSGVAVNSPIDKRFIPYDKMSSSQESVKFRNYEFTDFSNTKWNIGSIPRVKSTRMSKFKSKFNEYNNDPLFKFVGKRYIYFHQNYINDSPTTYKTKTDDPKDVYLHNARDANSFPPVLGLFRPNETRTRKKIIKKFNQQTDRLDKPKQAPGYIKDDKINHRLIDNDIAAGADIQNYFTGGDGLYYLSNPHDDTPDINKLGWITIYEDPGVFSGLDNKGMFDIVLGLTLAVGFESSLDPT